ncbi:MAG: AAA family ATPase [Treponema sp.]|nr:AAA family ATPase [Treponema sp.]
MESLKISIKNIKNIRECSFEFPLQNSLNLIVGNNASGKSTLLLNLSQALLKKSFKGLRDDDYNQDSIVETDIDGQKDAWCAKSGWRLTKINNALNGMYEGSLFYGTRFDNSKKIDNILRDGKLGTNDIVDADDYIKEKLSYILHGVPNKYPSLKRIRNKYITERYKLNNTPYFNEVNNHLISQYRMSSGECLLISLLHFIYNAIIRKSLPTDKIVLMLVDEIELALHPIAVSRFIDLLNQLVNEHNNLMVILTSHSPEVIQKIKPNNIYKIENENGIINVVNPGFPSYVIRDVYRHDGFDFLFLVEDQLAKIIIDKILVSKGLCSSKLIHVTPVGGWENVLKLHKDLLANNVLGVGKQIISILDGDVATIVPDEYKDLKKLFLPIQSVEKFLYEVIIKNPNIKIKKIINDKYFTVKSLDTLISEFYQKYDKDVSHPDKKLYFKLKKDLEERHITEDVFIERLSDDIINNINFDTLVNSLNKIIKSN